MSATAPLRLFLLTAGHGRATAIVCDTDPDWAKFRVWFGELEGLEIFELGTPTRGVPQRWYAYLDSTPSKEFLDSLRAAKAGQGPGGSP